jgi:hypothetical protein
MNRITVIFLALAILLAHTLAIHQTPAGDLAAPYEMAHVAFRVGRNLVRHGVLAWNPEAASIEAYPSALWIAVSAFAESRYVSPTVVAQGLGFLCALGTVVVLTQFSPRRMSGLIAPILLAASGTAAAASASGTEAPLVMLLVTLAFLAFERRWKRTLGIALALLVSARPEGIPLVGVFFLLEFLDRPIDRDGLRGESLFTWYVPALLMTLGLSFFRHGLTGEWLSPYGRLFVDFSADRAILGLHYLESYVISSGAAFLLILPILAAFLRKLSGTGRRAFLLTIAWSILIALSGGDGLPFWNALAAVVPISLLSIQEALTGLMDWKPRIASLVASLLLFAIGASFLASKLPGNLGRIPLERYHRAWMQPCPEFAQTYERSLGRIGLLDEIREVERLRPLGVFLRDSVREPSSIATFWPGAIGYLSRKRVHDILGRAFPSPGERWSRSWRGEHKVDLVAAFDRRADYIVPITGSLGGNASASSFLRDWLRRYDTEGLSEERLLELLAAIQGYELISVPVPDRSHLPDTPSTTPFLLLRCKELGLTPTLEVEWDGDEFHVLAHHIGHRQVVDLEVSFFDEQGRELMMRPSGRWMPQGNSGVKVRARASLLLYETGPRLIELARGRLPRNATGGTVHAQLLNPDMRGDSPLTEVGLPARVEID